MLTSWLVAHCLWRFEMCWFKILDLSVWFRKNIFYFSWFIGLKILLEIGTRTDKSSVEICLLFCFHSNCECKLWAEWDVLPAPFTVTLCNAWKLLCLCPIIHSNFSHACNISTLTYCVCSLFLCQNQVFFSFLPKFWKARENLLIS